MSGDEPGFVVAPGELDERGSQPLTNSLLARTIQAKDDAGWVARVVWGGVGWGFNDDPWARHHAPVWLTKR